jgi:hypothetical protein
VHWTSRIRNQLSLQWKPWWRHSYIHRHNQTRQCVYSWIGSAYAEM